MILMEETKRLIDPWCTNGVVSDSAGDALEGLQVARVKRIMHAPVIITKRLTLARLTADDADTLYAYRSDPSVSRYQNWVPTAPEDVIQFIESQERVVFDTPGTWYQFAIRLRESDRMVGDLGMRFPDEDARQVEIGINIAPSEQRKGYGTEAVRGALGYVLGVLGKHRVFASVDPSNTASISLLKRVGMRQEAHFRESLWIRGEWVDDVVFGILSSEWDTG